MDKAFVKKVLAVLLGISLVIMVYETASMIVGATLMDDLEIFQNSLSRLEKFIKWSAVALACMLIPVLASYVFAFFSKKKYFVLISAVLSFVVAVCCIAFYCVGHDYAMEKFYNSVYAEGAAYISGFIQIAVASILVGAYFLTVFLLALKKDRTETVEEAVEVAVEETVDNVEGEENEEV